MKTLINHLQNYISSYLANANKSSIIIGVSGGLDSAISLVLATRAIKAANVHAFMLPTKASNKDNLQDASLLCKDLGVNASTIYIDDILQSFKDANLAKSKLDFANLCARVRMCILYDASARQNALVLGCSNKSELMLGYGTIYGDLAYAFNAIGSIYKSDLYALASKLDLPKCFLQKPPSADLWEGQSDESELGFKYEIIDSFLKAYEAKKSLDGFDEKLKSSLITRIKANAFKLFTGDICKL